jgi:hypothetical protein
MAKLSIVAGATSQSVNVLVLDSSSTVGAGLSGLAYNTASLAAYYTFAGANTTATAITLATLAGVTSAWATGGFIEIDATHMKGLYRLDLPNAVLATAKGRSVTVYLYGAANMAPVVLEIELESWDNQVAIAQTGDAYARLGAPAGASIAADLAEIEGETDVIVTNTTGITFTVANQVDVNVVDWKGSAAPAMTGDAFARLGAPAGASVSADLAEIEGETDGIAAIPTSNPTAAAIATAVWQDTTAGDFTTAASIGKSVMNGVALGTGLTINGYTGNTPQTGDAFARLGAPAGASIAADIAADFARLGAPAGASIAADLAEIEAETDGIAAIPTSNGTNQTGDVYGLLTGANTELAAVPASTATLVDMLRWLFILSRNKLTQTATTQLVRNNADGATVGTSTVSDDGTTAIRGKFA